MVGGGRAAKWALELREVSRHMNELINSYAFYKYVLIFYKMKGKLREIYFVNSTLINGSRIQIYFISISQFFDLIED